MHIWEPRPGSQGARDTAAEALEGSGSLRARGLTGMWRNLGPGEEHGLAEGGTRLQGEETVNRQLNCLSLERGGGQEAEKTQSLKPLTSSQHTPLATIL